MRIYLFYFLLLLNTLLPAESIAVDHYWIASSSGDWSEGANWSFSSGGSPAFSVPTINDRVLFNTNGLGNCELTSNAQCNAINSNGFGGTIDLRGYELQILGTQSSVFDDIRVYDSVGINEVTIVSTANIELRDFDCDVKLNLNASRIQFSGGQYQDSVVATITGPGNSTGLGGCVFDGPMILTNSSVGNWVIMGRDSINVYRDDVHLNNQSTSRLRMAFGAADNEYHGDIFLSSTGGGIWFGESGGSALLLDGSSLNIGAYGFSSGDLRLRAFRQIGSSTSQHLTLSGSAMLRIQEGTSFDAAVDFSSPRLLIDRSTFNATCILEKTSGGNDHSPGGNTFVDNTIIRRTGTGFFSMGSTYSDSFLADLSWENLSDGRMYLAHRSSSNSIAGDLNVVVNPNSGRTYTYIATGDTSGLDVAGDVLIEHIGNSDTLYSYFGNNGRVDILGNLEVNNDISANISQVIIADRANSIVNIEGDCNIINGGIGDRRRVYLSNQGSSRVGGELHIHNSSSAPLSEVFISNSATSTTEISGDLTLKVDELTNDGVIFGNGQGTTTITSGGTLRIDGPYLGARLLLRNVNSMTTDSIALVLEDHGRIDVDACNWNGDLHISGGRAYCQLSRFDKDLYVVKTDISNDNSRGGNHVLGNMTWMNSGQGNLLTGNNLADTIQGDLSLISNGTGRAYFAHNSLGNVVGGDLSVTVSNTALSAVVANSTNASLFVLGDVVMDNTSSSTGNTTMYLGNSGDVFVSGDLSIWNRPTSLIGDVYVASTAFSAVSVDGNTLIHNEGSGSRRRCYIGSNGDIVIQGDAQLVNRSDADNSNIYLANSSTSSLNLQGDLILSESILGCSGVRFGSGGGTSTFSASSNILVDITNFIDGELFFRNLDQNNPSVTQILFPPSVNFRSLSSNWESELEVSAGRVYLNENSFHNPVRFTKTETGDDYSTGGNSFEAQVEFKNTGPGIFCPSNTFANSYLADVSYIQQGAGRIHDGINVSNTYEGDIYFDIAIQVRLGGNTGRTIIQGDGLQRMFGLPGSLMPLIGRLVIDKPTGDLSLSTSVDILNELELIDGILLSDIGHFPILRNNAICDTYSNSSYVEGPIRKIGNDAFTFPTGAMGFVRPIGISAPNSGSASFEAQYHPTDPGLSYDDNSFDITIREISDCEFWTLERLTTNNAVSVTLSWDDMISCDMVDSIDSLAVAHWNQALGKWDYYGGQAYMGDLIEGSVTSETSVTSFSPFALAKRTFLSPLPVELLSFNAKQEDESVLLSWETASEVNNDRFEIERSVDGLQWQTIGQLQGSGNSSSAIQYQYLDTNPYSGYNYYRLKQVDFDGAFEYFGPEVIFFDADIIKSELTAIRVSPNPFTDQIRLTGLPSEGCSLDLIESSGRVLQRWTSPPNLYEDQLDLSAFKAGIYFLRIQSLSETRSIQVIKE